MVGGGGAATTLFFQSHYGAIATCRFAPYPTCHPTFQSHYGAIATRRFSGNRMKKLLSIPLWCDCNWRCAICSNIFVRSFNPTMVRLQPRNRTADEPQPNRLSIPLWCDCNATAAATAATAAELSIPLWCDCNLLVATATGCWLLPFNPTMVRLQQVSKQLGLHRRNCFQSHYGAIATDMWR